MSEDEEARIAALAAPYLTSTPDTPVAPESEEEQARIAALAENYLPEPKAPRPSIEAAPEPELGRRDRRSRSNANRNAVDDGYEGNWYDAPRAALQGLTFGGSDEIGSALAATMVKLDQLTGTGDPAARERAAGQSWGDIYSDMQKNVSGEQKAYAEARPEESLPLEIVGGLGTGIVSGGRMLGGKILPKIFQNMPKQALTKALETANKTGAGRTLTKALANKLPTATTMQNVGKAAAVPAIATGQGALYGGLAAEQGERTEGALTGGTAGGVMSLLPMAIGKGVNAVAKRRVAQELGEGDNFIPLNQADAGGLGDFVRNTVGASFGGRDKLAQQNARIIGRAEGAKKTADRGFDAAKDAYREAQRRAGNVTDDRYATKVADALRDVDTGVEGKIAAGAAGVTKATQEMNRKLVDNAIPSSFPKDVADSIRSMTPFEANKAIKEGYKQYGFKSVNNKNYKVSADQMKKEFTDMFKNDPAMKNAADETGFLGTIDKVFGNNPPTKGRVSGAALMELRNELKTAGGDKDRSKLVKTAAQKMAAKIDDLLKSGMNPKEKADFADDLSKWSGKRSLTDSVASASTARQGLPSDVDVLAAARKKGTESLAEKRGSAQIEAEGVQTARVNAEDIKQAALKEAKLLKELETARIAKGKRAISQSPVKGKAEKFIKARYPMQRAVEKKRTAQGQYNTVKRAGLPEKPPSTFSRLFQTGLLGGGYEAGNLLTGTMVGRALGSEGGQRFMAGQTAKQKALAELLRKNPQLLDSIAAGTGGVSGSAGQAINDY